MFNRDHNDRTCVFLSIPMQLDIWLANIAIVNSMIYCHISVIISFLALH